MRRALLGLMAVISLVGCTSVFFQPQREHVRTPAQIGLEFEDVYFASIDGTKLHGWFLPARAPVNGTVLFLHGNTENISTHIASVYWLPEQGFSVFLIDYRGYGASQGTPTLAGIQGDIAAAVQWLHRRADVDRNRIFLFGQSLGGALALYYAAQPESRGQFRAVVSESAFSSYRDIAREKLSGSLLTWPLQWLAWTVDDEFSPLAVVGRISPTPLVIVHGDHDEIVPPVHGQRLYDAANLPKDLWIVAGAGHIETFRRPEYRTRLVDFFKRQPAGR